MRAPHFHRTRAVKPNLGAVACDPSSGCQNLRSSSLGVLYWMSGSVSSCILGSKRTTWETQANDGFESSGKWVPQPEGRCHAGDPRLREGPGSQSSWCSTALQAFRSLVLLSLTPSGSSLIHSRQDTATQTQFTEGKLDVIS